MVVGLPSANGPAASEVKRVAQKNLLPQVRGPLEFLAALETALLSSEPALIGKENNPKKGGSNSRLPQAKAAKQETTGEGQSLGTVAILTSPTFLVEPPITGGAAKSFSLGEQRTQVSPAITPDVTTQATPPNPNVPAPSVLGRASGDAGTTLNTSISNFTPLIQSAEPSPQPCAESLPKTIEADCTAAKVELVDVAAQPCTVEFGPGEQLTQQALPDRAEPELPAEGFSARLGKTSKAVGPAIAKEPDLKSIPNAKEATSPDHSVAEQAGLAATKKDAGSVPGKSSKSMESFKSSSSTTRRAAAQPGFVAKEETSRGADAPSSHGEGEPHLKAVFEHSTPASLQTVVHEVEHSAGTLSATSTAIPPRVEIATEQNSPNSPRVPEHVVPQETMTLPEIGSARILSRVDHAEMHLDLRTTAFGEVQVHTVIRDAQVGVTIGNERGDLGSYLSTELAGMQKHLQQHDLRFEGIQFVGSGTAAGGDNSGQGNPQSRNFSHGAWAPAGIPALEFSAAETDVPALTMYSSRSGLNIRA